jgi:hypothetical protein
LGPTPPLGPLGGIERGPFTVRAGVSMTARRRTAARAAARATLAGSVPVRVRGGQLMVVVDGAVVRVVVEVWKPQVAVLESFHAEADRQPTGGEVHGEVQIAAALHQAVLQRIAQPSGGLAVPTRWRPQSCASLTAS